MSRICIALFFYLLFLINTISANLNEGERLREYEARGYEFSYDMASPPTEGWKSLYERRWRQVEGINDGTKRYDGWLSTIAAGLLIPNFTENGWGLSRAPTELVDKLKDVLHKGLPTAQLEQGVDVIEGTTPYFIPIGSLVKETLDTLKPYHEAWSNVTLLPSHSYGLRAYRNNSNLLMHVDKPETHVISSITHIDHSEDSDPWPLVIEDLNGNTNEVILESGDMLFYESSKLFHGRPHLFKGSWYCSIFTHYRPDYWDDFNMDMEIHYAVPKHWNDYRPVDDPKDELVMVGTSMKEPNCENLWCGLEDSIKWEGPGIEGEVITNGWKPKIQQNEL